MPPPPSHVSGNTYSLVFGKGRWGQRFVWEERLGTLVTSFNTIDANDTAE